MGDLTAAKNNNLTSANGETSPPSTPSALEETLWLLNRVIVAAATSIVVTDPGRPDHPIVFHNPAFERVTGYSAEEITGRNCRFLQGEDTDKETVLEIGQAIREGRSCDVVLLNYRKDRTPFWNHLYVSPVHDRNGNITHFVGVQNDVTVRVEAQRERDELFAQQRRVAERLQQALLMSPPERFEGVEIDTQFQPAAKNSQLGGDFYDVFALDADRVVLVVGDVTGKGLAAAQHTAEIKYAVRVLMREYESVSPALTRLNRFVVEAQRLDDRDAYSLVCIALAVLNTATGAVNVSAAGMEAPLIVRANGDVVEVTASGVMVGIDSDASYFECGENLEPGDSFVMVTDGITEARRSQDRTFFGFDGLVNTLESLGNRVASAAEIGSSLVKAVKDFAGEDQADDMCLLIARRVTKSEG